MPIGGELDNKSLFKFGKKWGEFSKFSLSGCVHSRSNSRSTKKNGKFNELKVNYWKCNCLISLCISG